MRDMQQIAMCMQIRTISLKCSAGSWRLRTICLHSLKAGGSPKLGISIVWSVQSGSVNQFERNGAAGSAFLPFIIPVRQVGYAMG